MQAQDAFKMHGAVTLILEKANGEKEITHKDNLIVDVGFDFIADAIGNAGARPAAMGWIAIGSDATAAANGNTALIAEITRLAATYAHTAGTKVFSFSATFNPGTGTGAITEAGVINAAAAGIMLDRVVFPVVNKGADDTLTAVFTFTMS